MAKYDRNVDYREMYYKMARATERAIRILVNIQLECEELYLKGCGEDPEDWMLSYDSQIANIMERASLSSDSPELPEKYFSKSP